MKLKLNLLFTLMEVVFLLSCRNTETNKTTLFTDMPSSQTHVEFSNDIKEDENYNILTYEYLYNGGGVAVGDINGDGLPDIYFTGNMVSNKLYLNKGGFQFEDITDKAGVKGRSKWKTGAVMADVNGDGLLDIYVCYSGPGTDEERSNELYINNGVKDGVPSFTESAKQFGLDAPGTYTTTVSFFDMDNDGDLDMFMVNHADMFYNPFYNTNKLRSTRNPKFGNRLYRNDNGKFTDISEQAHIDGSGLNFGLSVSISDINDDGWSDIYVTNDYDERDFLYLNNQDGTFREVLAKAANHISEFAMGSDIADYNNDDKPDVMVLDMLPEDNRRQKLLKGADAYDKYTMRANAGFHHQQMRNTLQLNNGVDTSGIPIFSEVGQMAGISNTDWSWSALFADFDNDGWKDLFISNGIFKDITNLDFVKYTSGYSSQYVKPENNKTEMWQLVQDMPSTKLSNYLFRNNHKLGFTNVAAAWGLDKKAVSNGSAYADLDDDGDLDLVINNLDEKATIYKNNISDSAHSHYIKLRLKGKKANTYGIGAKVYISTASGTQMQEQYLSRGFQSSIDPVMHIGLGSDSIIKNIVVKWPGSKASFMEVSYMENVKADTTIAIESFSTRIESIPPGKPLFHDITNSAGIDFIHKQPAFVDFKITPLLPYQLSKIGPAIASGDVNDDGLDDVFIGAGATQDSWLYLQSKDGRFAQSASQPWNADKNMTISDALFFDADNDGDKDLYFVSGGADYPLNNKNYQDVLYENDGHGNFKKTDGALPMETVSGSCVRAGDFNKDGLTDLFVGGKIKPGLFPEAPESFVLENKSTKGHILFEKSKAQTDTTIAHPGMVTDAAWVDINKDGWQDLIVAGEFMPITVFENHNGVLVNETKTYGLDNSNGWWCRILADDFDNDGDTDLVIGNLGTNTQLKASDKEPLSIVYGNFYGNGATDAILCYYNGGKNYPYYSKDEVADQIPSIQKQFLHYSDYADVEVKNLLNEQQWTKAHTAEVKTFQSVFIRNNGNKSFALAPLPDLAQVSALNGMVSVDIDGDGNKDIVLAGNFYPLRVQLGPLDASIGLILKGDGKGGFIPLSYERTHLQISGDVRNLIKIKTADNYILAATKNNGAVQLLRKAK